MRVPLVPYRAPLGAVAAKVARLRVSLGGCLRYRNPHEREFSAEFDTQAAADSFAWAMRQVGLLR